MTTFSIVAIHGQYWGMNGIHICFPPVSFFWTSSLGHEFPTKIWLPIPMKMRNVTGKISALKALPFPVGFIVSYSCSTLKMHALLSAHTFIFIDAIGLQ